MLLLVHNRRPSWLYYTERERLLETPCTPDWRVFLLGEDRGFSRSSCREKNLLKPPFASNQQRCCCEFGFLKIDSSVNNTKGRERQRPSNARFAPNQRVFLLREDRGFSRQYCKQRDLLKPPFASTQQYCCCEFSFLKISSLVHYTTAREGGSLSSLPIHSNTAVSILVEDRGCGYLHQRQRDRPSLAVLKYISYLRLAVVVVL